MIQDSKGYVPSTTGSYVTVLTVPEGYHCKVTYFLAAASGSVTIDAKWSDGQDYSFLHSKNMNAGDLVEFGGEVGKFLVMHAGDTAACREAEALIPGIVTAAVKKGYGIHSALHLTKENARALIRKKAEEAMSKIKEITPYTVEPNPEPPLYVFRQVGKGGGLELSDDGKGTRITAPNTVEYYGDDLIAVLKMGTY